MTTQAKMNGVGDLPLLLTADETAQLLRKSRKAIYTMVDRGQIPGATKIGRNLLFRRDDVIRWLDESRASSPKESRR